MRWPSRKARDRDLDRELRGHLEAAIADQRERGLSAEDARRAAQRTLGNTALIREEVRDTWGWMWLERLSQDVRYAGRQFRRSPAFTVAAVLTLALGIGANTAIFSVADAVLLRPLPYPNSHRLVMIWNELARIPVHQMDMSAQDFAAFRTLPVFETSAAFQAKDRNLIGATYAERVSTLSSTNGLLEMLGAHMAAGRRFTVDDWKPDRNRVAILSHAIYVRRFAGDPAIVGRTIRLDDSVYTVVGVLASDFEFGFGAASFDVWTPLPPLHDHFRDQQFRMLALLRPGVSMQSAQAAVAAMAAHLKETVHPYEGPNGEDAGYRAWVISLHDQLLHDFRAGTLLLLSAVALVLLIACANVANLLLARAAAREKEIAIRRALGATRLRLVRQWLTEAALLTLLGGATGVALSFWGVGILRSLSPIELPSAARVEVDWRTLLFTLAISAAACLLFSIAPVFAVFRITGTLRGPRRRSRMSGMLVAAEVALALLLLIGSGLLLKSFAQLRRIDTGIRADHLLTMLVQLSGAHYQKASDRIRFFSELEHRLAQLPGVIAVSSTDRLPVFRVGADTRTGNPFSLDGSPWDPAATALQVAHTGTVGLNYFRTLGIPLLAGREFSPGDTLDATPVAIINRTLARKFFPGQDPIGKRILFGAPTPDGKWLKIVGVVGDIRTGALDLPPMQQFYMPQSQEASSHLFMVMRTVAEPLLTLRAATAVLRQLDPEISPSRAGTMEEHVEEALGQPRFRTLLLVFFGATALFLAAVGIYGVVAHAVAQRTSEIGIRMALGADAARVTTQVLAGGLRPVVLGLILGFACTAVLVRYLSSVLYQVTPTDPVALGGAAVVLSGVAVMACLLPARRASRLDPMVALRYE